MKFKFILLVLCLSLVLLSSLALAEVSRQDALIAIDDAKETMKEMQILGFNVVAVNDTIEEAYFALERADFAEVLRSNITGEVADQAREILKGLDHQGFTYEAVFDYVNKVEDRKDRAYALSDGINIIYARLETFESQGVSALETKIHIKRTEDAFELERYTEAEEHLVDAFSSLDAAKAESTTVNVVIRSSQNFFYKHWQELSLMVFGLIVISYFWWIWTDRKRRKDKIHRLELEAISLKRLQKHIQVERFQKANLSQAKYMHKKNSYDDRLKEIQEQIPVLKKRFKRENHVFDIFHGKIRARHHKMIKNETPKR